MWMLLGCARLGGPTQAISSISIPSDDGLQGELVVSGALSSRVSTAPADVIIFYGGEERGSLEPCGCTERPRGGLARQAAYIQATKQANPGTGFVTINGGGWLDDAVGISGQPRPETATANRWMVAGVRAMGVDVLNVGYPDMAGLSMLSEPQHGMPLVSANLTGEGIAAHTVVQSGGLRIGVTGISTPGSRAVQTPGFVRVEPFNAGHEALQALQPVSDLTVLVAYQAPEAARRLARMGLVDVVIDVQQHQQRSAPMLVGDAIWVRSHYQTMRQGELRLRMDGGDVVTAVDRKIDLDPEVPSHSGVSAVVRSARLAMDAVQQSLYGR